MSAPHPSMFLAGILSAMPDLWQRTLGAHSPDASGCCMACRDLTGAASWPCLPHAIAEFARHIAGAVQNVEPADVPADRAPVDAGILDRASSISALDTGTRIGPGPEIVAAAVA